MLAGACGGESSCAFNHDHRMPIVREPQQSGLLANTSRRPGLCLPLEGGGRRVRGLGWPSPTATRTRRPA